METAELTDTLRDAGHRVTRARRAVWTALHADAHLTVEQLADRADEVEPGTDRASVYRALDLFEELGLARQSRLGDEDAARWELAHPDEHFHLVCEECGRIDHHVGSLVAEVREHLASGHGFEPREIDLAVTGVCADCRNS